MYQCIVMSIISFSVLVGCSSSRHQQLSELGFTRPYLEGYQDGCHSRMSTPMTFLTGFRRDPERMAKQGKYANGWQDGFEHCYGDERAAYH